MSINLKFINLLYSSRVLISLKFLNFENVIYNLSFLIIVFFLLCFFLRKYGLSLRVLSVLFFLIYVYLSVITFLIHNQLEFSSNLTKIDVYSDLFVDVRRVGWTQGEILSIAKSFCERYKIDFSSLSQNQLALFRSASRPEEVEAVVLFLKEEGEKNQFFNRLLFYFFDYDIGRLKGMTPFRLVMISLTIVSVFFIIYGFDLGGLFFHTKRASPTPPPSRPPLDNKLLEGIILESERLRALVRDQVGRNLTVDGELKEIFDKITTLDSDLRGFGDQFFRTTNNLFSVLDSLISVLEVLTNDANLNNLSKDIQDQRGKLKELVSALSSLHVKK